MTLLRPLSTPSLYGGEPKTAPAAATDGRSAMSPIFLFLQHFLRPPSPPPPPMPRLYPPATSPRAHQGPLGNMTTLDPLPTDITDIIFDHLIELIPLTLAVLSKACYNKLVPHIYKTVIIRKANACRVLYGMCLEQTAELPYPYGGLLFGKRKAKAFEHTKKVVFEDIWAAEALVLASREFPTHEFGFMATENSYPLLFPHTTHLLLGKALLRSLPDCARDVSIAEQKRWETNHVLRFQDGATQKDKWVEHFGNWFVTAGEFEDLLFRMVDPEVICFDMQYVECDGNSMSGSRVTDAIGLHRPKGRVVIHWFFYSAEEQRPLFGEIAMSTPITIIFHTSPPPNEAITDPEIALAHSIFSSFTPLQAARELALAVDRMIEEILNFTDIISDDRLPGEEECETCEIELVLPQAEEVRRIWKWEGREDRTEEVVEFTETWERIVKFRDVQEVGACEACGRKLEMWMDDIGRVQGHPGSQGGFRHERPCNVAYPPILPIAPSVPGAKGAKWSRNKVKIWP
ncbi:hypothetical protein I350_00068 [Cryptococcus amylolentus CBS 6273]|uniref:Uncharacterized protein n=1 Tax=Cryptococcus amylolentus CBS 6273 TaxID=1296118 RepID=A0A1E3KG67_9TREE|nr:hypothetical protein I350_00068 [Cryptococcus amylolentus CBS 6273]